MVNLDRPSKTCWWAEAFQPCNKDKIEGQQVQRPEITELYPSEWGEVREFSSQGQKSSSRSAAEWRGAVIARRTQVKVGDKNGKHNVPHLSQYSVKEAIMRVKIGEDPCKHKL